MAVGVVGIIIILVAALFWHSRVVPSQGPQALAFSTTFGAALLLITGVIGYSLQGGTALPSSARWSGAVIWPQVIVGAAFLIAAMFVGRERFEMRTVA